MAACEVCIDSGREDALAAIGVHAVVDQYGTPFLDRCKPCLSGAQQAERNQVKTEHQQQLAEMARIRELVGVLGDRGLVVRTREERYSKRFSSRNHYRDVPDEPAWPVGNLNWKIPGSNMRADRVDSLPSGITRTLEIVPMDGPAGYRTLDHGWASEHVTGRDVLNRSAEVRKQVIEALERVT
jgi:hypothetical protein